MELLNDYLQEIVSTARHCAHCKYNHNGICFFAYICIKQEFSMYDEDDESQRRLTRRPDLTQL